MNRKQLVIICVISLLIIAVSAAIVFSRDGEIEKASVYKIIPLTDVNGALLQDAEVLGLDLSTADYTENHFDWTVYENDQFVLRRHRNSGYFTYLRKDNVWKSFEVGNEPISESELREQALALLEKLGIPRDQVYRASVKRVVDWAEDKEGNSLGNPTTANFLVYIMRQIDGMPVYGSTAEVIFTPEGELNKINTSWRKIDPEPVDYQKVVSEEVLLEESYILALSPAGKEPDNFHALYAYRELPYEEEQEVFELQYVYTYGFDDTPIYRENIAATE